MRFMTHRTSILATVAIAFAFLISACVEADVQSEFETDGSGNHSVRVAVDRALLDTAGLPVDLEVLDIAAIESEAEQAGFNVEEIDTADQFGIRVSTQVEDNEDFGEVLNDLLSASGIAGTTLAGFDGGFTESNGLGDNAYSFELTVDGDALIEDGPAAGFDDGMDNQLEDELGMEFSTDMLAQALNLTYTISMPGDITDHNGTDLGGGRVQWEIPFQGTETFYAESEDDSGFSIALIVGIIAGVIVLALLVVGGSMLLRPQKTPAEAHNNPPKS